MASEHAPLLEDDSDTSNSYDSISPTEQPSTTKPTPLPKLQLFNIFFIQFGEPLTATVIYPFIVHLLLDTGVTGGDEARTGYFAGIIVRFFTMSQCRVSDILQESIFFMAGRRRPLLLFFSLK